VNIVYLAGKKSKFLIEKGGANQRSEILIKSMKEADEKEQGVTD